MQYHPYYLQRRQLAAGVIAITTLYTQYSLLLMAQAKNKERAEWADLEVRELIDYLHQNRSESVGGNFSGDIYDAAADHIAKYLSQGPKKTGSMCKTKWASVCYHC